MDSTDLFAARSPRLIALVVLTNGGLDLALRLQRGLATPIHIYANRRVINARSSEVAANAVRSFDTAGLLLAQLWNMYDQIVLFFALGAAVRLIAPHLQDKHTDPGVVVIDDVGTFAISVVAGHAGGANDLARQCAQYLGAIPVITTASDVQNTLAADLLGNTMGWHRENASDVTTVSAAIVNGEPVALLQEAGQRDWWDKISSWPRNILPVESLIEVTAASFAALLIISDRLLEDLPADVPTIVYRPPSLVLGVGCRRGIHFAALDLFIRTTVEAHHLAFQSIAVLASADIKADEEALQMLAQHYSWLFETHTVEALKGVTAIVTPSEHVQRLVGTPSVSEAAALLSAQTGQLVVPKQKGEAMTVAVARRLYR
ncbi:MAG: cobalamin biosynthesis protein [Ktedonobacteraceae bacterium]|nr:cobalamin biosynthesis protein [Ktedonobacteraceae bacterium]